MSDHDNSDNADSRIKSPGRKVWLDDYRDPPPGWEWAKSYDEVVKLLEGGDVDQLSLDHDLADIHYAMESSSGYPNPDPYAGAEKTGYHVCLWMAENNVWPRQLYIHSMSTVGRERMKATICRYAPETTGLVMSLPGRWPNE